MCATGKAAYRVVAIFQNISQNFSNVIVIVDDNDSWPHCCFVAVCADGK